MKKWFRDNFTYIVVESMSLYLVLTVSFDLLFQKLFQLLQSIHTFQSVLLRN